MFEVQDSSAIGGAAKVPTAIHNGRSIFKNIWIERFHVQVGGSGGQIASFDTVEEAKQFIERLS